MNEREIERLLKAYGDTVPPCAVPAVQPKPLRWPRFAAAGIATIAVAGIAVVGLFPQNATAKTVARVNSALSNAKTMEYTVSLKIPSGWHPVLHAYYENGSWRFDTRLGTPLEYTAVLRDGMQLIDYKTLDHASLDVAPPDSDLSDKWQTALDFAKRGIDTGNTEIQRSLKIHDHDPVDGKPVYEITMERPSDHYIAKILVDKQTDLPIESSVVADDQRPGFGDVPQQIHTEFQFNKPLDPQMFSLDRKGRTVIRMQDARDRLKKMWRTPIGSVGGADIRSATVTRDGTIWIAVTATGDRPVLPTSLTDDSGQRYIRGGDVSPGAQLENKAFDDIFGKPIYVSAFAPMPDTGSKLIEESGQASIIVERASDAVRIAEARARIHTAGQSANPAGGTDSEWYLVEKPTTIQFVSRDPSYVNPGRLLERSGDQSEVTTVVPTREAGDVPSYFKLLGLDRPNTSLAQSIWRAKAQALESDKQYLLAAQAYGQLAKARFDWVKYSAFQPMLDEARCYRLIGETDKAKQLTQEATLLKASRER